MPPELWRSFSGTFGGADVGGDEAGEAEVGGAIRKFYPCM